MKLTIYKIKNLMGAKLCGCNNTETEAKDPNVYLII